MSRKLKEDISEAIPMEGRGGQKKDGYREDIEQRKQGKKNRKEQTKVEGMSNDILLPHALIR